jgi:hypothetical protein
VRVRLHVRLAGLPYIHMLAYALGTSSPDVPHVACPECGNKRVRRLARRDRIDRMSDVAWSTIQRHLGGKLYHCALCRLQFYDCRKQALDPIAIMPPTATRLAVKASAQYL